MSSSRRRRRPQPGKDTPFYEQQRAKADAQERVLQRTRDAVRSVKTSRPFTPADSSRGLFGVSSRSATSPLFEDEVGPRPPSAFPMGRQQFLAEMPETDDLGRPATAVQRPSTRTKVFSATAPPPRTYRAQPVPPAGPRVHSASAKHTPQPPQRSRTLSAGRARRAMPTPPTAASVDDVTRPATRRGLPAPPRQTSQQEDAGPVVDNPMIAIPGPPPSTRNSTSASQQRVSTASLADMQRWENVEPLLAQLEPSLPLEQLHQVIATLAEQLGSKSFRSGKRNAAVLRSLYRLLDAKDPRLLVRVLRLVLLITRKGATLANACKLLFKLSRSEANDALLQEEGAAAMLVNVLTTVDATDNLETLVYCCGALKNISNNENSQAELVKLDVLAILKRHLDNCLSIGGNGASKKQQNQLLVQSTAALRNLASDADRIQDFVDSDILQTVGALLGTFPSPDLALNIARVFGKVTLQQSGRDAVMQTPAIVSQLAAVVDQHPESKALVIRVYFVLGNLVAADEDIRQQVLAATNDGDQLLQQFQRYASALLAWADTEQGMTKLSNEESPTCEQVDVVIKLVRLLANLCVSDQVGPVLVQDDRLSQLCDILAHPELSLQEELVMNLAGAVNNMSFHNVTNNYILEHRLDLALVLVDHFLSSSMDLVAEVGRVFGNFSQLESVRDLLVEHRVHELLVVLLQHENRDVVHVSCGILMNLAGDVRIRSLLDGHELVDNIIEVLISCEGLDWHLAGTCCKGLWNFLSGLEQAVKNNTYQERVTVELLDDLVEVLSDLLGFTPDAADLTYDQEFASVAKHLHNLASKCSAQISDLDATKQPSPLEPL
eukprot:m.51744 g.51744  ORF g.51744 m.51744 type:complete len:835 (+) comp13455_c0_seq3:137-2641(+)